MSGDASEDSVSNLFAIFYVGEQDRVIGSCLQISLTLAAMATCGVQHWIEEWKVFFCVSLCITLAFHINKFTYKKPNQTLNNPYCQWSTACVLKSVFQATQIHHATTSSQHPPVKENLVFYKFVYTKMSPRLIQMKQVTQ